MDPYYPRVAFVFREGCVGNVPVAQIDYRMQAPGGVVVARKFTYGNDRIHPRNIAITVPVLSRTEDGYAMIHPSSLNSDKMSWMNGSFSIHSENYNDLEDFFVTHGLPTLAEDLHEYPIDARTSLIRLFDQLADGDFSMPILYPKK